jgi:hypothetical protein
MGMAFSKYTPHVVECLASNYIDYNPIPLIKVRSCFTAHRWGGVSEVYSGLKYGIELGYIEAVPYGRLTRYKPTLIGTVKSAIMDAVMEALGIMNEKVIDATERVSIILYSNLLLDIPILISQRGSGRVECACCTENGKCFGYKRVEGRDKVYLGMIALKVLAGVEVRGVKPRDYWQLFSFVRDEALFYLKHGFRGFDPEAVVRAIPFITLFLFRFDREWFVPKSKVKQFAMRLLRQWQLSN